MERINNLPELYVTISTKTINNEYYIEKVHFWTGRPTEYKMKEYNVNKCFTLNSIDKSKVLYNLINSAYIDNSNYHILKHPNWIMAVEIIKSKIANKYGWKIEE